MLWFESEVNGRAKLNYSEYTEDAECFYSSVGIASVWCFSVDKRQSFRLF
jgi:hypothetical protein